MAEQEQVETAPSSEAENQKEESLDEVLSNFSVEDTAKSFNAQPNREAEKAPDINIPDPNYDPDGFKNTMKSLYSNDWEVKQSLNRISEQLQGQMQERQRAIEEEDLNKTISKIQESIPALKGKDRLVKGYLGAMAAEEPRLTKAWEQRRANPQAWNKALGAISKQMAKDFEFSADPQLTENTRAAKASRDQMATTARQDPDEQFKNMSDGDFERYWQDLTSQ